MTVCCTSSETLQRKINPSCFTQSCCSDESNAEIHPCQKSTPSADACCHSPPSSESTLARSPHDRNLPEDDQLLWINRNLECTNIDLEKGFGVQHAVVHVSGMTCTGCERKLQRVLSGISGVHNLKTSLVSSRAEFDVVEGLKINQVMLSVEKQTDFKCTVSHEGHQLEVLLPGWPSKITEPEIKRASNRDIKSSSRSWVGPDYPPGVKNVEIIDFGGQVRESVSIKRLFHRFPSLNVLTSRAQRKTARITYDPRMVGARHLLQKGFDVPLSLAPLGSVPITETKQLGRTLSTTLISIFLPVPVLIFSWASLPPQHAIAYSSSSLALATLVQFIIAGPFYPKALKALIFSRMIEMDILIVISTTIAYLYSVVAYVYQIIGIPLSTGEFFQTSTLLTTLIMCGRLASAYARKKAMKSISIEALQPSTAILVEETKEMLIDLREFQYGDLFKVLPDAIVPTDGIIISGETEIDESMTTGEAIPVFKHPGSPIVAGSINISGPFVARLTRLPLENTISEVVKMVNESKLSKPRIQDTADRVASYFVPCILALSLTVFLIWVAVGITIRASSPSTAVVIAITYALSVLVVSCPCAVGLAVPMVMVIAGGIGAKHGVIFKSSEAVEIAKKASHIVFDKTGTLTKGEFNVVEEIYFGENRDKASSIAKVLTANSRHPISQALANHFESLDVSDITLQSVSSVLGKGMHANLEGQEVKGGNPLFVGVNQDQDVQRLLSEGLTVFCLRHGVTLLAILGLRDSVRSDTASCISTLQARNIAVSMISGDSCMAVERLAMELGIPLTHSKGQCSPEDKARYVSSLSTSQPDQSGQRSKSTIVFCGDGTNDALALAKADIGIHMAGGTDVAKSAADIVLTHPSLGGVLDLMDISQAAMHRVYLNFAWSFIYNLFAILLAAGAFVKVRIPPAYAGIGELVSVLPVIAVAMQLHWKLRH